MSKILIVATEVQKAVIEQVLLTEIVSGFWKNARPADHADSWKGVTIEVGTDLGAKGFDMPRNYNFVNPDFFRKAEGALMEAAQKADENITPKKLKKQLIALNQILGSRLKETGGPVAKLSRGRKLASITTVKSENAKNATVVRKAMATFVEEPEAVEA